MVLGKSIRIYLKEGTVSGIKQAEIVNHTIQALSCPRVKLVDLNRYFTKESNRPGVYFLIGQNDNVNVTYIGESENVWERLKNHDTKKEFWDEVIVFTSKDENLTKSHVKYLESRLISIALSADRYKVQNITSPSLSSLPLADQDSMEDFILNVKLLNGTLGHKFLESQLPLLNIPVAQNIPSDLNLFQVDKRLYLNVKGINAQAVQTDEGLVVLENSYVSDKTSHFGYRSLREKLVTDGTISTNSEGRLHFVKKHLFESPSAAAAVILGYSVNGRNVWKDNNGNSLNDIEKLLVVTV